MIGPIRTAILTCATALPAVLLPSVRAAETPAEPPRQENVEVVVYGGTPAGIMAAIAAARRGHRVALIDLNAHVGGMVSGGLVATDMGDRNTVGGLAGDLFHRIETFYADKYGPDSAQSTACRKGATFEPHVAEQVFEQMLREQPRITVWKRHRYRSVTIDSDRS